MDSEYQVGAVADIIARLSRKKHSTDSSDEDNKTPAKVNKRKKRKLNESNTEVKGISSKKPKKNLKKDEDSKIQTLSDVEIPGKEGPTNKITKKSKSKTESNKIKSSKNQTTFAAESPEVPTKPIKRKKSKVNEIAVEIENVSNSPSEVKRKNKTKSLEQKIIKSTKTQSQSKEIDKKEDVKDGSKKNKKQLKKKIKAEQLQKKPKGLIKSQSNKDQIQPTTDVKHETKSTGKKQRGSTDLENKKAEVENILEPQVADEKSDNQTESKGFPKHVGNTSDQENEEPKFNEEQESRTIFVGNLPLKITRSRVTNMFKQYGEVETVRFRSVPVADIKLPRKACVKMNKIHEKRTNMNAYVRFKNVESVEKALALNGLVIEEHTIRVDSAIKKTTTNSHAIFIGNLPFEAEEEELRKAFEDCGEIDNVRVIRDQQTNIGKGFAYVNFKDCGEIDNVRVIRDQQTNIGKGFAYVNFKSADAVAFALEMENVKVRNREVRIKRSFDKRLGGKSFDRFSHSKSSNGFPRFQGKFNKSVPNGKGAPQGRFNKISDKGRDGFKGGSRGAQKFSKDGGGRRDFGGKSSAGYKGRSDTGGFRFKDNGTFNKKDNSSGGFKKKFSSKSNFQGSTVEEKGNKNNQKKKKLGYDALKKFIIAKKLTSGGEKKKAFNFLSS